MKTVFYKEAGHGWCTQRGAQKVALIAQATFSMSAKAFHQFVTTN